MASHDFTDVPDSHPFHAAISNLVNAGITGGCDVGLYCPDSPVTRAQMAAFLGRGLGRAAFGGSGADIPLTPAYQDLAYATITVGGVPGETGFVLVTAAATGWQNATTGANRLAFRVVQTGGAATPDFWATLYPTTNGVLGTATAVVTWVFTVPSGTAHTFRLQGTVGFGPGGANVRERRITAVYIPFGSAGGPALGPAGDALAEPDSPPVAPDTIAQ